MKNNYNYESIDLVNDNEKKVKEQEKLEESKKLKNKVKKFVKGVVLKK